MSNVPLDQNSNGGITGLLNTDGETITPIKADPTTHGLSVDDDTTGSDNGGATAAIDQNGRYTLYAESSAGDGTLVALYVDSTGHLLIDSS